MQGTNKLPASATKADCFAGQEEMFSCQVLALLIY